MHDSRIERGGKGKIKLSVAKCVEAKRVERRTCVSAPLMPVANAGHWFRLRTNGRVDQLELCKERDHRLSRCGNVL